MSDTPQYCVECERLSRERDGLLNGNRDLHEECQRLRAQVELMQPVVNAACQWESHERPSNRKQPGHRVNLLRKVAAYRAANGDKA